MEDTWVAFCLVCMWVALRTRCKVCFKENLSFSLISDSPRFIPQVTRGPSTESVYCRVSHGCGQIPAEKQHKEEGVILLPQDGIWSTVVESHGTGVVHGWSRYF